MLQWEGDGKQVIFIYTLLISYNYNSYIHFIKKVYFKKFKKFWIIHFDTVDL